MSLILLLAATLSTQSAAPNLGAEKPVSERSRASVTVTASVTIIHMEKVNPLAEEATPTDKVIRPIAKQRSVKAGVPYVEFY